MCELASALRVPRVIVPGSPGTLSALGVLLGDVVKDHSRTVMIRLAGANAGSVERRIEREFAALERDARKELAGEGFEARGRANRLKPDVRLERSVAMRYVGQSFEISVPWSRAFDRVFHAAHRERFGYADSSRTAEIVSVRVRASGITDKPRMARARSPRNHRPRHEFEASVFLSAKRVTCPVFPRGRLSAGAAFKGPAVITEYSSTTLIPPGRKVVVDPWLNMIID